MARFDPAYRLDDLATLPVFFKLRDRKVVVAGASLPAVWKTELLQATGAIVLVFDPAPCDEMLRLAKLLPPERLILTARTWVEADLAGAALAIGAFEDDAAALAFRDAARRRGTPVNVIDKPAFCDFQFGTIVARDAVLIGISTNGAAPVFGQALRSRVEAVLPANLAAWARAAEAWRPQVQARALGFQARRRFWERFSALALDGATDPDEAALALCFEAIDASNDRAQEGGPAVTLVGSGIGTPDTMTLGAIAALQKADLVIHDADVAPAVVGLARREAEKRQADPLAPAMTDAAAHSRVTVWLGTGDPYTCARWRDRRTRLVFAGADVTQVRAPASCPMCADRCRFPAPAAPT